MIYAIFSDVMLAFILGALAVGLIGGGWMVINAIASIWKDAK